MSLNDDLRLLNRVPVLEALGPDALRLLAFSAEKRMLAAGNRLYSAGDRADCAFLLMSGSLDLTGEAMPPKCVRGGTLIGEMALIAAADRPTDADVAEDVHYMVIRRTDFRRVLEEYPDAAQRLQHYLQQKLVDTQQDLRRLTRVFQE